MTSLTKNWPTASEKVLGWTERYPRPTEETHHPAVVPALQKQWDEAEALRVRFAKRSAEIQAEKEAKLQHQRDEQQAARDARQQAQRDETEAVLKRRFLTAGGSENEWLEERDDVISEHRRRQIEKAETADDRARRVQAGLYRSF